LFTRLSKSCAQNGWSVSAADIAELSTGDEEVYKSAMRVYRISGAGCQLQIGIYVHQGEVTLYLRVKTGAPVRARAAAAARNSSLRARFSARDFAV
jgi:hypothetical protein